MPPQKSGYVSAAIAANAAISRLKAGFYGDKTAMAATTWLLNGAKSQSLSAKSPCEIEESEEFCEVSPSKPFTSPNH